MKKRISSILISIVIVILFFCIRVSYNNSPSYSLFLFLKQTIEYDIKNGVSIKLSSYPLEFNLLLIEIIICSVLLIVSSFLNNWIKIISLLLFVGLWLKNYIILDFVVDKREYLITSLFFLLTVLIYIIILIFKTNLRRQCFRSITILKHIHYK